MDPVVVLGITASVVTILAFLYMLFFGQRGLVDWLERRQQNKTSTLPSIIGDSSPLPQPNNTDQHIEIPLVSQPQVQAPGVLHNLSSPSPKSAPTIVKPPEASIMDKATQEFIRHIAADIEAKRCIFLIGAGISIEAGLPNGSDIAEMLAKKAKWEYANEPLKQIAQKYTSIIGPVKPIIHDYLVEQLTLEPTGAHYALACLADKLDIILTTNWEYLLTGYQGVVEQACRSGIEGRQRRCCLSKRQYR
ncbi:MAG: hypothetical protein AB1894_14790 [Chloroflexota bacterium]